MRTWILIGNWILNLICFLQLFLFGHSFRCKKKKCHFLWSENSHFCQKCPFLRPKPFFPCKKYKKWNRRRTAEGVLKSKNWRKQIRFRIQFPINPSEQVLILIFDFSRSPNAHSHHFYSSNIPQILPWGLLFHEIITFKPDFGQISILLIFGPILGIFPL